MIRIKKKPLPPASVHLSDNQLVWTSQNTINIHTPNTWQCLCAELKINKQRTKSEIHFFIAVTTVFRSNSYSWSVYFFSVKILPSFPAYQVKKTPVWWCRNYTIHVKADKNAWETLLLFHFLLLNGISCASVATMHLKPFIRESDVIYNVSLPFIYFIIFIHTSAFCLFVLFSFILNSVQ